LSKSRTKEHEAWEHEGGRQREYLDPGKELHKVLGLQIWEYDELPPGMTEPFRIANWRKAAKRRYDRLEIARVTSSRWPARANSWTRVHSLDGGSPLPEIDIPAASTRRVFQAAMHSAVPSQP
jgi:hypothetical protein